MGGYKADAYTHGVLRVNRRRQWSRYFKRYGLHFHRVPRVNVKNVRLARVAVQREKTCLRQGRAVVHPNR